MKTVRNHTAMLSQALSTAVDWDMLERKPKIEWPTVPPARFDFLDGDERERLIAAADGEWRNMITVALHTGLRLGELRALRWDGVDTVRAMLVVRQAFSGYGNVLGPPKSGKDRTIPLNDAAAAAFRAQKHLRGRLCFCNTEGKLLTRTDCRAPIWRACKRAGLRQVGWHVCRHSFASGLVMVGVPIRVVQELLGHATIEMTMRYSHLSPGVTRDAVQTLVHWQTYGRPPEQHSCAESGTVR
jgi:integrase